MRFQRWRRILLRTGLVLGLFLVLVLLSGTFLLRGSLARLDGEVALEGLTAEVTITRDHLGIPDITAGSRIDAARALGFLHGQDRFFQMDLLRRSAAGEMSALIGPPLLDTDRKTRRHRFRTRARTVLDSLCSEDLLLILAYTDGVNAGLDALRSRPFEYLFLRQKPQYWEPEDTVLVLFAMYLDLSYSTVEYERQLAMVRDNLPVALATFLMPRSNPWEAPLQTETQPPITMPDTSEVDVRQWTFKGRSYEGFRAWRDSVLRHDSSGSNNWAVAGNLTGHGGALLANDMHLEHRLPNVWYRVRMSWPEKAGRRAVVGASLPGTPFMVVGSNGDLAWGFTNSYGDWSDLVILETDPADSTLYLTPDGWQETTLISEVIEVAGAASDTLILEETVWGPVWGYDTRGNRWALRWTAHDLEAVNLNLRHLETATSVDMAVRLAGTIGIPHQNLVCADRDGRIAWTIAGPIPNRVGWDGRLPVSWSRGNHRWDGYRDPRCQPRMVDPPEGRIWTANNRVTSGSALEVIGDGGYSLGARARQIRDHLRQLDRPTEKDMLAVQLDDRALYMDDWRQLALEVLERQTSPADSLRTVFHQVLAEQWSGRAEPASVSYRLVKEFHWICVDVIYDLLVAGVDGKLEDFRPGWLPHRSGLAWQILQERPAHLLHPVYDDYDDLILQTIDATMRRFESGEERVEGHTWGKARTVRVHHPFVQMVPQLSRWLAADTGELPGDSRMPRVQGGRSGASQRMVVSPGREEDGIFHMPGGQSGHPLSPFFLAGHEDWTLGKATPLLPGPPEHELILVPVR